MKTEIKKPEDCQCETSKRDPIYPDLCAYCGNDFIEKKPKVDKAKLDKMLERKTKAIDDKELIKK